MKMARLGLSLAVVLFLLACGGGGGGDGEYVPTARETEILSKKAGLTNGAAVIIGNSITEALPMPPAPFPILNAGIWGANTLTYYRFLGKLLQRLQARLFVVALGVNDAHLDIASFPERYEAICSALEATGAQVAVATVLPTTNGRVNAELIKKLNEHIANLSRDKGYLHLDSFSAIADERGYLPSAYTYDGLHLNDAGNEKLKGFYIDKVGSLYDLKPKADR